MRYQRNIKQNHNKAIITESQESKSISAAKKLVMKRLGYNEQEADEFVRIKLRGDIPTLRTPQGGKFILGVTRMFCNRELKNANIIGQINNTLKYVASNTHINEYDRNLNGLTAQELIDKFATNVEMDLENDKNELNSLNFNNPNQDYDIVRIDSFQQAREYGDYTSWCVTHDEYMFDSYTADGINQFYFCLKKNFETIPAKETEGCPLDEYGLSMIAVCVNENGALSSCTCRWNHAKGADDNVMNTKQISEVIGMNFYQIFKPNKKWSETVEDAIQRLANGEAPNKIFNWCGSFTGIDEVATVRLGNKYNLLTKDNKIVSPNKWFDLVHSPTEGFAKIKINDKWNFIDLDGNILSPNKWFDDNIPFLNGYAGIMINDKWNFINTQGNIISPDMWFDNIMNFNNGYAPVKSNNKWNHIDGQGNILSPNMWFDYCEKFRNGFAIIGIDNKQNYINTQGNIISPDRWYFFCGDFSKNGVAQVQLLNYDHAYINTDGKLIETPRFGEPLKVIETKTYKTYITQILRENINNFIRNDKKQYKQ